MVCAHLNFLFDQSKKPGYNIQNEPESCVYSLIKSELAEIQLLTEMPLLGFLSEPKKGASCAASIWL